MSPSQDAAKLATLVRNRESDEFGDERIRVRGRVDERMFYGPKLEMWTEISTTPGSDSFVIHDSIRNHGAHDQEFQLIYHANYGPTLLEQGSKFAGPIALPVVNSRPFCPRGAWERGSQCGAVSPAGPV